MFIRQTRTNNKATGEGYYTFRLVRGERIGGKVRQITVLNLGRHFPIKQEDWPLLCSRIEQLLQPQAILIAISCPAAIERAAQRYVGQLIERALPPQEPAVDGAVDGVADSANLPAPPAPDFQEVDVDSLQQTQPRSVGVEHVALHALEQLGFVDKLTELGINGVMRACILGNLIGRMAQPASELATWDWLQNQSALGELLDVDFAGLSHMRLYRASDLLMQHREAIEGHMFSAVQTLFKLEETVTLFDLTNTYFEGAAASNPKAKHGRSKEKRTDCPLVTLGMVLDGSGFVSALALTNPACPLRVQRFCAPFQDIRWQCERRLDARNDVDWPGRAAWRVIMDAGGFATEATEDNLAWLVKHSYRYLVVRRGGARQFDAAQAVTIETAGGESLRLQKEVSEDGKEVRLYCHSEGREAKETAMMERFCTAFEAGLQKIADGLNKPRGKKRRDKILERIGRLKEKSRGVSQHYSVDLVADEAGMITGITREKTPISGTMATHPGVYCLRSNEMDWDEERMWRTYTMLTDLESVHRMKGELGWRRCSARRRIAPMATYSSPFWPTKSSRCCARNGRKRVSTIPGTACGKPSAYSAASLPACAAVTGVQSISARAPFPSPR